MPRISTKCQACASKAGCIETVENIDKASGTRREQESPELRKHMQDLTSFEFQASSDDLTDPGAPGLTELAGLAKTCLDRMKQDRRT